MAKTRIPSTGFFIQLFTACFFLVLGICGIFPGVDESIFSLNNNYLIFEAVLGVLELVCALVLFAGLFTHIIKKWMSLASLLIFIFWLFTIVFTQFFNKVSLSAGAMAFVPSIMEWILNLMLELVVLAAIWTINRRYAE